MKTCSLRFFGVPMALLIFASLAALPAAAQATHASNAQLASPELNARVEALLKKMTLDEKLGMGVAGWADQSEIQIANVSAGMPADPHNTNNGALILLRAA